MWADGGDDPAIEELAAAGDRQQLCRLLLHSAWGWGSSTSHQEAVGLLRDLPGDDTVPTVLV
ncbi:MAG TPA: hypothetical protein VI248_10780, partial [Kineosporiaceae bacterium]